MAPEFASRLLDWWSMHGRKDLPWQNQPRDIYRVWISEVMLQQTQVSTVVDYFEAFTRRFPDIKALAAATEDEVLNAWSGLGYYARARNLYATAKRISDLGWPGDLEGWMSMPGVGRSTAAAVLAQTHGQCHAILDGNVKRVLARHAGIDGWPGRSQVLRQLWTEAESRTPAEQVADYTQAIMDLGSIVCTARQPNCDSCPVATDCVARSSDRQTELPAPRPRRTLPERETHWLIARREDGAVMLKHRPPTGVWGGLWSPPEAADAPGLAQLARSLGVEVATTAEPFRHAFTHFRLTIHPHLASPYRARGVSDDECIWFRLGDDTVGVPRPLSVLMERLV
jgi:A/G-specific adenine glycosylase